MTSTYPALKAKFGTTEYYLAAVPIGEIIGKVKFPVEMPDWESQSVEERYQRNLDERRIKKEIAPYFAEDDKRFSGSLVLAIMNGEKTKFEELTKVFKEKDLPALYQENIENMGFLIFSGKEIFVPLDGQHRVKAFNVAIEGLKENQISINPNPDLAKDIISVIFVFFDGDKARYIFNKINKYAKPTKKADKLITDDDDAVAVITRRLIRDSIIPERLVNIKTNTLSKKAIEFTTLATFNDANYALLSGSKIPITSNPQKMEAKEIDSRFNELCDEWGMLLSGINEWKQAIEMPTARGDRARIDIRANSLLGRPIGQLSLVKGYSFACQRDRNADRQSLVRKMNRIEWNAKNEMWRGVLIQQNGRIMHGKSSSNNAAKFIAHLLGAKLTQEEVEDLLTFIHGTARGHTLPRPVS